MGKNNILFIKTENLKKDVYRYIDFLNALLSDNTPKKIFESNKQELNIAIKRYVESNIIPAKIEEPLDNNNITSSIIDVDNIDNDVFKDIHIHFRIYLNQKGREQQMMQLHYLSLILEKYSDLVTKRRLSIFIVPDTKVIEYPFYDDKTSESQIADFYNDVSAFLRLLVRENNFGVIYSVSDIKKDIKDTIVKAIDYKCTSKMKMISPLSVFRARSLDENSFFDEETIEKYIYSEKAPGKSDEKRIDANCLDNYNLVFQKKIAGRYFDKIKELRNNYRFGFAKSENAIIALADYLFEAAYRVLQRKFIDSGLNIKQYNDEIHTLIDESSIFCFVVFAYVLFFEKNDDITRVLRKFFALAKEISSGVSQLVQNSLQHSELNFCAVSFYVSNYDSQQKLIVLLSDLSNKDILDTFFQNIEKERNYINSTIIDSTDERYEICGLKDSFESIRTLYEKMIDHKEQLSYGMFFNDFVKSNEQGNLLWEEFRKLDSSAHVGLAIFSQTIKKCDGSFIMTLKSEHKNKCSFVRADYIDNFMGTNFIIDIPIKPLSNIVPANMTKVAFNNEITENYQSYARYLDFNVDSSAENRIRKENIEAVLSRQKKLNLSLSIEKFSNQFVWTRFWLTAFQTIDRFDIVYSFDMQKIFDGYLHVGEADYEMITKGLINAVDVFSKYADNKRENDILFAFKNLSKDFFAAVIQLTVSLALKSFSENVQLFFICSDNDDGLNQYIHLLGKSYGEAVCNSFHISIENGSKSYEYEAFNTVKQMIIPIFETTHKSESDNQIDCDNNVRSVFPFTSFISLNNYTNLFFDDISRYAEKSIIDGEGYKLSSSHTRLGNKVHIDSFYEMSFVFYRTIVANRIAFEILRSMIYDECIGKKYIQNANILFFGYASYSEAILISITDILKAYRGEDNNFMSEYALYQYNLRTESQSEEIEIQMSCDDKAYDQINVVQIVPISSTMTTFRKIWNTFQMDRSNENRGKYNLLANYTAFWAKAREDSKIGIERFYKEGKNKTVISTMSGSDVFKINYILTGSSSWYFPEKCSYCYPKDVINEVPLIETDPTSTVPAQQLRLNKYNNSQIDPEKSHINNLRLKDLNGCVHYGHYVRGNNHFQIYVETQKYFSDNSKKIAKWLKDLRKNNREGMADYPCLNIIFSPEHNTNVGFSQYVNSHYFNGNAEIISINEDKEYRSNFICEFADLHHTIKRIWDNFLNVYTIDGVSSEKPVRFYFADDSIVSGGTFHKANSFLRSLIPFEYRQYYPTTVFERCFLLINRISIESQQSYIALPGHFHSYCNVDVSNMRKQGDSCTCCKFREDAISFFRKSATNGLARYWKNKCQDLKEISFDQINSSDRDKNISYLKLVLSHISKNYFKMQTEKEKIDVVTEMFDFFVSRVTGTAVKDKKDNAFLYIELSWEDLIKNEIPFISGNSKETVESNEKLSKNMIVESLIKVLTRPFFTFEHEFKSAILVFMIALAECFFNDDFESMCINPKVKTVVKKIAHLYKTEQTLLIFFKDVLFEAFADLHSTYLMRRQTIDKLKKYIDKKYIDDESIWKSYLANVQRTIQGSSDETRITRFEYQLLSDEDDYSDDLKKIEPHSISEKFKDDFYRELFLMNGCLYFEDIRKSMNNNIDSNNDNNSYYVKRLINLREMDHYYLFCKKTNSLHKGVTEEEKAVYKLVHEKKDIDKNHINERYNDLLKKIKNMLVKRYDSNNSKNVEIKLAILNNYTAGNGFQGEYDSSKIARKTLQVVSMACPKQWNSKERSDFKFKVKTQIIKNDKALRKTGYTVEDSHDSDNCIPYFIIYFDNQIKSNEEGKIDVGRQIRAICPVYLYVEIDLDIRNTEILWFALRDILSFRDSILTYLECDFTSDVLSEYARLTLTETILHAERAISHTSMKNDNKELADFLSKNNNKLWEKRNSFFSKDKALEWAYAKNYANTIIAKLYNNMMIHINREIDDILKNDHQDSNTPMLYVSEGYDDGIGMAAGDLMLLLPCKDTDDSVFGLFREIINIEIAPELRDAKVYYSMFGDKKITYNFDYLKGIIYRMLFDALLNHPDIYDVNFVLNLCSHYRNQYCFKNVEPDSEMKFLLRPKGSERQLFEKTKIEFSLEDTKEKGDFKWLVVKNTLRFDVKYKLEEMYRKLEDPIDYNDGHISTVAMYEYVCKLHQKEPDVREMFTEEDKNGIKKFITKLPIIRKDNYNG